MTAYIKMIEIWLILVLFYPFCVVSLYSFLQFLKENDRDVPVPIKVTKAAWKNNDVTKIVLFLLDFGLPFIFLIFIIIFWILGIIKTTSIVEIDSC